MKLYSSLSGRLKDQHTGLRQIILPAGEARLRQPPVSGKWSIHDNIAHLAKYQPVFLERLHRIVRETEPVFERYRAEDDPEFEEWRQRDTYSLLDTLHSDRTDIFDFVTGLPEMELRRGGIHSKLGRMDIGGWTEFFLLHEAHHLFTVFRLVHGSE